MYNVFIRPLAKQDIQEIIDYYDQINPKLSDTFLADLENRFNQVIENPEGYQKRLNNIRGVFLKNFPIGVYYKIYDKKVVIISVLHTSRNPEIWKKR